VCVTKFTHSRVDTTGKSVDILTFNLSSKCHFPVGGVVLTLGFRLIFFVRRVLQYGGGGAVFYSTISS